MPWLRSVAVAGLALTLAVAACEAALRLFWPGENVHATATLGIFAADPDIGWVLQRGLRRSRNWSGRPVTIRTDEHGHRIAEGEDAAGQRERIAFAGDSYVFGNEVNAEETFVHLIGNALGPERGAVNLGVGGYSLSQECQSLRRYLSEEPGIIRGFLVIYLGNDIEDGPYPWKELGVDDQGYLRSGFAADPGSIVLRNSRLAFDLYAAWRLFRTRGSHQDSEEPSVRWIYDERAFTRDRIAEHMRVLAALRDDTSRRGVPITVVLLPEREQVEGVLGDLPDRRLAEAAGELGFPVVDLLPRMRRETAGGAALYNEVVAGHLSPKGHEVVAAVLLQYLAGIATAGTPQPLR